MASSNNDDDFLVKPKPAPALNIPSSPATVDLYCVDTGALIDMPVQPYIEPHVYGHDRLKLPAYVFLIHHRATNRRVLFDNGVNTKWDQEGGYSPYTAKLVKKFSSRVAAEVEPVDVLQKHGIAAKDIDAVIWSHYHWDHTGDMTRFPASTALVVGPGFTKEFVPGWPTNPDGPLRDADWEGRELREIDFDKTSPKIGRFYAHDFFGDGSLYLLDTPGHATGHLCALVRTTSEPPTFAFLAGDACHHCAEIRPTEYSPLPKEISPPPPGFETFKSKSHAGGVCPGAMFQAAHPTHSADRHFYEPATINTDNETAKWTISGMEEFDAAKHVLVALAHDDNLPAAIPMFPERMNDWFVDGAGAKVHWRFLKDFHGAVVKADGEGVSKM